MDELEKRIVKLEQGLLQYKAGQGTQGDSTGYFTVEYMPGWFILDESRFGYRIHTVECVVKNNVNAEHAIFMPTMVGENFSVQAFITYGRNCTLPQNIITWEQWSSYQSNLSDADYAAGIPKGFIIYSNVDFTINTSYVDTVY